MRTPATPCLPRAPQKLRRHCRVSRVRPSAPEPARPGPAPARLITRRVQRRRSSRPRTRDGRSGHASATRSVIYRPRAALGRPEPPPTTQPAPRSYPAWPDVSAGRGRGTGGTSVINVGDDRTDLRNKTSGPLRGPTRQDRSSGPSWPPSQRAPLAGSVRRSGRLPMLAVPCGGASAGLGRQLAGCQTVCGGDGHGACSRVRHGPRAWPSSSSAPAVGAAEGQGNKGRLAGRLRGPLARRPRPCPAAVRH